MADPATVLAWVTQFLTDLGVLTLLKGAIAAAIVIGLTFFLLGKFGGKTGD